MNAGVQHLHDKLFRTVFADTQEAALFLRGHLPAVLTEQVEWSTLALVKTGLVGKALCEDESAPL